MAYVGTTAASSVSNPPISISHGLAGGILGSTVQGTGEWFYATTDGTTVMESSTYFTDAFLLGMRQGDLVRGVAGCSVGSTAPICYMGVLGTVSTAGAGLSTAGTMTSTFS